ncbi:MAG: 5-nucleotidase [Labilithrix sp.]|nr:5-nucleotidase [Labilithrix sp.]
MANKARVVASHRSDRARSSLRRSGTSGVIAALAVLAAGALTAATLPGCASDKDTVASACPPGQVCSVNLTLLHTSDIHSRLFPYEQVITQVDSTLGLGEINSVANIGGVARMAYVINRERARSARVLHLDSGDCFQGAPIFNFFAGEPEVRAMSQFGVDAAVLGNHEFDRGANNITTQFRKWSNYSLLSANYKFDQTTQDFANYGSVGTVTRPFTVLNTGGLKVAAIGMANLSSLTSIFDTPNRSGLTPLNTIDVAQTYIDVLRPYVDLVVMVTHLGLDVDQRMVRGTTGIDVVLGGHNHIVINPPQQIQDCSADENNPGYVWAVDPNAKIDTDVAPPTGPDRDPVNHPYSIKRPCTPRKVLIAHSGAFAKYVGRLDLVVSNDPNLVGPGGNPAAYDPVNGFEVQESRYTAFPIDATVPEDPVMADMLQPYRRSLDLVADLDTLIGFSPTGSKRFATSGGDSPLGNVVGNAIWLRLGIQTDFSLTNSTGIRTDLNPGPITTEQMYNIFPFDNSISKMQLSGLEVQQMFDFSARRTANRGCASQIQIAGARVRLNCSGCDRVNIACTTDEQCQTARPRRDFCDVATNKCVVRCASDDDCAVSIGGTCDVLKKQCEVNACAEQVYIGHRDSATCLADKDCNQPGDTGPGLPGSCDKTAHAPGHPAPEGLCMQLINETNLYELATSNYLAGGGSGFRVLQRNTTQLDTRVQQRDALIDYMRAGKPCGFDPEKNGTADGLKTCSVDGDCGDVNFVCSCPGHVGDVPGATLTCATIGACEGDAGRCVRKDCRDQVAQFHQRRCDGAPDADACKVPVAACPLAGEECKILSCVDQTLGSQSDNRVELIGR